MRLPRNIASWPFRPDRFIPLLRSDEGVTLDAALARADLAWWFTAAAARTASTGSSCAACRRVRYLATAHRPAGNWTALHDANHLLHAWAPGAGGDGRQ